jgi:hypothetical protein
MLYSNSSKDVNKVEGATNVWLEFAEREEARSALEEWGEDEIVDLSKPTDLHLWLRSQGYSPIPVCGKRPPMDEWQKLHEVKPKQIWNWRKEWPNAKSTGILTKSTPAIDIDILDAAAVEAVEGLIRKHFGRRGTVIARVGKAPKRLIPFRTDEPFKKFSLNVIAPDGKTGQKIEILGDGQQFVAYGIHPDTKKPYQWHGGELSDVSREDLPCVSESDMKAFLAEAEGVLATHGYTPKGKRPKKKLNGGQNIWESCGEDANRNSSADDWQYLLDHIREGHELHDSLLSLAAKMVTSGMAAGAVVNFLRGAMNSSEAPRDDRWQNRYYDIPRLVKDAEDFRPPVDREVSSIPGLSDEWCDVTKVPRRQWLYGQHYIRGLVTSSVAEGGVGKSTLAVAEAICLSAGDGALRFPVEEQVKVWYWNGEEPRAEIKRRVHAACQHHKIDPYAIAKTFHFTSGLDEFPIKIVTATKKGITVDEKLVSKIIAFIQGNDIGAMVIDPLIKCHGVPENDNTAMDVVNRTWGHIAAVTNCSVELIHHTRKGIKGDTSGNFASDARGAGATMDGVRGSRVLNRMSEKEAGEFDVKDRFEFFRVDRGKVNMIRQGEAACWYRLVSVHIGNGEPDFTLSGDNVQTVERWAPPSVFDTVTTAHMHAVRAKVAVGEYLRDCRAGGDWVGVVVAEVVGLDHEQQRPRVEKIVKHLIALGVLKTIPRKNKDSKPRLYVESGDWEPPQ